MRIRQILMAAVLVGLLVGAATIVTAQTGASGPISQPRAPVPITEGPIADPSPAVESTHPRLPFGGAPDAPPSGLNAPRAPAAVEPQGIDGARKHLVEPKEEKAPEAASQKKKPAVKRTRKPASTADKAPVEGAKPNARTRRSTAASRASAPAPAVTDSSSHGLPPLPAALPYNKPGSGRNATPTVVPDSSGNVVARIPEGPPRAMTEGGPLSPEPTPIPSPQTPRPLTSVNPFAGFIRESFDQPIQPAVTPPAPQRPSERVEQGPPSFNVLNQLGHDVKQLGSGIKDVFQSIIPGR